MLAIKFIKENLDAVRDAIRNRGVTGVDLEKLLKLEEKRGVILQELESKRAARNKLSDDIAKITDEKVRENLIEEATAVKADLKNLEIEFNRIDKIYCDLLVLVPNVTSPDMPFGHEEADNVIMKVWLPDKGYIDFPKGAKALDISYMPEVSFEHKDHVTLGESLDVIDVKQSAVVSGSRFCYLKNEAVLLQEAIFSLLKNHLLDLGYSPMYPPILVKEKALFGTSHFPEGKEQIYKIENFNVEEGNDLYLVGSSEPANFSYFADKTLYADKLPIKVYAQTVCFRSEVGSWGKDVRGIKRVHQFNKVEMNSVCLPDQSQQVYDEFLANNEWLLQALGLPYRLVNKCTGDCGYNASYLQCDPEVWRPGEKEFMEVGTSTITTDYQARRLNIKYKKGKETGFVHTVNDTGATDRLIIGILENNQNEDGSVTIPEILRPLMRGLTKIEPK